MNRIQSFSEILQRLSLDQEIVAFPYALASQVKKTSNIASLIKYAALILKNQNEAKVTDFRIIVTACPLTSYLEHIKRCIFLTRRYQTV